MYLQYICVQCVSVYPKNGYYQTFFSLKNIVFSVYLKTRKNELGNLYSKLTIYMCISLTSYTYISYAVVIKCNTTVKHYNLNNVLFFTTCVVYECHFLCLLVVHTAKMPRNRPEIQDTNSWAGE